MALQNGDGDFVQRDQNQPFQIDALPSPVLKYICNFLPCRNYMRLQQVCWGMQDYIDNEYGIHAYLPSRNFNPNARVSMSMFTILKLIKWRLAGTSGHITDAMTRQAILNWKGKVIRSLEINEIHPDFIPLPFHEIVNQPRKLKKISLKYVDVPFLLTVLSSCRNLSEFEYETGLHRQLPQGFQAWLEHGASFQPVPIPLENEQLIEYLTKLTLPIEFQVARLTSLSLILQMVNTNFHSDWANVVFLLLALSHAPLPNLRYFKFTVDRGDRYMHFRNRLQIIACVGQFLSGCPTLKKLEYISQSAIREVGGFTSRIDDVVERAEHWFPSNFGPPLPQNVFSGLGQKFGSDLLKQMQTPIALETRRDMWIPCRQIMVEASRTLTNLQDVNFTWACPFEAELFQILISSSRCIRASAINDRSSMPRNLVDYNTLFPQMPPQRQPFHLNIEKLCYIRCWDEIEFPNDRDERTISLSRLLHTMTSLKHLEITLLIPMFGNSQALALLEEHEPFYWLEPDADVFEPDFADDEADDFELNDNRTPDIILDEAAGDTPFRQLEILKLTGVRLPILAVARLSQLTNLKELFLEVVPEYRHDLFGINSGDLLKLVGSLRKLDKLSVNMILFPEDDALN